MIPVIGEDSGEKADDRETGGADSRFSAVDFLTLLVERSMGEDKDQVSAFLKNPAEAGRGGIARGVGAGAGPGRGETRDSTAVGEAGVGLVRG